MRSTTSTATSSARSTASSRRRPAAIRAICRSGCWRVWLAYAEFHFLSEETLMAMHRYPEGAAHAGMHAELLAQAAEFARRFGAGEENLPELVDFLGGWFIRHTQQSDAAFGRFLQARAGGRPDSTKQDPGARAA
jgi:hemerythrin-like metal-binding protein